MMIDWLILGSILLVLTYTMIVIKEEKISFKENALIQNFRQFTFHVPSWWGEVESNDHLLRYQRLDTRYEWEASFSYEDNYDSSMTIEDDFKRRIHKLDILFDPDSGVIMNPSDFNNHPQVKNGRCTIVRVEGMATQSQTLRRYFDAFLIWDHQTHSSLFATSMSSILNGLVEGPYFEEVMLNFEILDKNKVSEL